VATARALVKDFWVRAYTENITGMAGMVAYNLLLSVLPLALVALFIASRLLQSTELQDAIFRDLSNLFPASATGTLDEALTHVKANSTGLGIGALLSSIWFGSSFWGALDTAFCRIYALPCRSWVQQKAFALAMLVVVLLLMVSTIAVPTGQALLTSRLDGDLAFAITFVGGVIALFAILCLIFRAVPNERVPWCGIWPGALGATLAITAIDYAFPVYFQNVSAIANVGTTLLFVVIVLVWFYALALIILGAATLNAMRLHHAMPRS
jgi:YihY family inner membrane protein